MQNKRVHWVLWYVLAAVFVAVCLLPIFRPQWFDHSLYKSDLSHFENQALLFALCPIAAWLALSGERLPWKGKLGAWFFVLCMTTICEVVHYWVTDRGHYFGTSQFADNTAWQVYMHGPILRLEAGALPHSFRFLPDAIVQIFTWFGGDFVAARIAYRILFNALLFVAIFRYARTYVTDLLAGLAVLVVVALYPITILKYAGQFVDPMSDLGFVACLLCLARAYEPGFGPNLFVALFAKEAAIVMAACRAMYGSNRWRSILAAALYACGGMFILLRIRLAVTGGHMEYGKISGVGLDHAIDNLRGYREWILMYVATFGALLPGTILGWKYMDRGFKASAIIIVSAMIVSSTVFSWLSEVRNMVPAFVVLAVVNVVYLERKLLPPPAAR